jgi:putative transposase
VQKLPRTERRSRVRIDRDERGIWQRRFWEHTIRDETDYARHIDYVHWNPVKHGHAQRVMDWPYSSFHRYVKQGLYPLDWAGGPDVIGPRNEADHPTGTSVIQDLDR